MSEDKKININTNPPINSKDFANSLLEFQKLNKEAADLTNNIENITDYTKRYNEYLKKSHGSNIILNKLNKDRADILKREILSMDKIKNLEREIQESKNAIVDGQKNFSKETMNIIKLEEAKQKLDDITRNKSLDTDMKINKRAEIFKQLNETIGDITGTLTTQCSITEAINALEKEGGINIIKKQKLIDAIADKLQEEKIHQEALTRVFGDSADNIKNMKDEAFSFVSSFKSGNLIVILYGALKLFDAIKSSLYGINKEITDLQRGLMVSHSDALLMRVNLAVMEGSATGVGAAFVTVKNLLQASVELSEAFGASTDFTLGNNKELLTNQISLTKEIGLSGEEAGKLQTTMMVAGMNEKQFGEMTTKSTLEVKKRTGVTITLKQAMQEISKLSAATTLSLMKNPKALADAVTKSKELGVSMDKMNNMADSFLDIESSISAQFEASVLTGKNLNFELAREKFLRNDIAGASAEVLRQVGSAADFTGMNRIQQEALAKAIGMTRDELAGSLITQENLNKLGSEERKMIQDKLKGLSQEAQAKAMANITDEKSAYAYAKKIDAQTKMNQLQEKFLSLVTSLLVPLEPILYIVTAIAEGIASAFSSAYKLFDTIFGSNKELTIMDSIVGSIVIAYGLMVGYAKGKLAFQTLSAAFDVKAESSLIRQGWQILKNMVAAMAKAVAEMAGAASISWGVAGLIGIAAGVSAAAYFRSLQVNDMYSDGYGSRTLIGPEGTMRLNNKDTVLAGTNLFNNPPENNVFSGVSQGDKMVAKELSIKFDKLIMSTNNLLESFNNKSFNVNLDGKRIQKELNDLSQNKYIKV